MAVWGGLTNSQEKKRSERQRRKEKIYPSECRVPKNSKERQENFSFFDGALFFLYFIFYVNLRKNRELCYFFNINLFILIVDVWQN